MPRWPAVGLVQYLGFPLTFVNVYGAKSGHFAYKNSANGPLEVETYDLEELYIRNLIPLIQNENFEGNTSLGDIRTQSIVHYRIGVLPLGQLAKVTFYFRTPPGMQNKVQIFKEQVLENEFTTPLVYDWWEDQCSIPVTGDGNTIIDVYFRPARGAMGPFYPVLFFKGAEVELM